MTRAYRKAAALDAIVFVYGRQFAECDGLGDPAARMDCRQEKLGLLTDALKRLEE